MPNVSFIRRELANLLPLYYLIRDVLSGEVAIKKAKTTYLPMPNAEDTSKENKARYDAYLKRAVFYNVARRTLSGLVGQVFFKDPIIEVPTLLQPVVDNADGGGLNLIQLAKKAMQLNLAFSRGGVFIDYPQTDENGGASISDLRTGRIRPTLTVYSPHEIVNWRTIDRGADIILSLVVIFELYWMYDDGFETKTGGQFRVLRLDEQGFYVHEIWREPQPTQADGSKIPKGNFQQHVVYMPTGADGKRLTEIPFMFFGTENNDSNCDNPNFYDICSLNIAHYRNSADYEESCYMVGQSTPVATGLTEEWVANVLKGSLNFGSRGGIPLPAGADLKLVQAQSNTMLKEAMDAKERQMVALGAKLVEQKEVQRTATEASLEGASESCTLSTATKNTSAAIEWALKWASRLIGQPDDAVKFELNTDFDIGRLTPEERAEVIKEWQANAITFEEMRTVLRKGGVATEDDEKAKAQIEADTVAAMGLIQPANTPDGKQPDSVGNN